MPIDTRRLPRPNAQVIHRSLPDGAVLFSTTDEVYFGLNTVASRVWELLPPALATVGDVCAALGAEYPDVPAATIRSDVLELLDHLEANGLISPATNDIDVDANVPDHREAAPAAALRAG